MQSRQRKLAVPSPPRSEESGTAIAGVPLEGICDLYGYSSDFDNFFISTCFFSINVSIFAAFFQTKGYMLFRG